MFLAVGRLSITLAATVVGGLALTGCAGGEEPTDMSSTIAPRPNSVLFEFTGHASPKNRTLTTQLVKATRFGADLQPQSVNALDLDQYGGGSPMPASIVDMITDTNSCVDNYPTEDTFQCGVTLRQSYPRALANMFVQVTSILSDSGADISSTHAGENSYGGNTFGIDASKGLWQYTADAYGTNPIYQGVLAQSPNNTGDQTWIFANPDDADTNYTFAVWATDYYADYTFGFQVSNYMDACSGGTSTTSNGVVKATLPSGFDFTLYGVNSNTGSGDSAVIEFAKNGQIGIGTTALTASGTALDLPSTSAPHPIMFPFWDGLKYGAAGATWSTPGEICYQTIGSAPSRMFVIEWRNMDFSANPGMGSSLDFEAFLYEGTGEIDTVYNIMNGTGTSNGRENGATAWVGNQDQTGTIAQGEYHTQDYGSGNGYSYTGNPQ
jgi:hypothetical protein